MQVSVRDNNVDQAYKVLKKKLQREGVFREMKIRDHYEKPRKKRLAKRLSQSAVYANWHVKPLSAKAKLLVDASVNHLVIHSKNPLQSAGFSY